MIIINPGTKAQENHSADNAIKTAEEMVKVLGEGVEFVRNPERDDKDGWYGFTFKLGDKQSIVDIPGIDSEIVLRGEPWVSPRLYVDGSSWLIGYAYGFINRDLGLDEDSL